MGQDLLNWKKNNSNEKIRSLSNLEFVDFLYTYYNPKEKLTETFADKILLEEIQNFHQNDKQVNVSYKKEKLMQSSIGSYYPRKPKVSFMALSNAKFKCELNSNHTSFIRKIDGTTYMEPHHLIPLSKHADFSISLDIPENIVSLCSECHNKVHYGQDSDVKNILTKLFKERELLLKGKGIEISLETLYKYYNIKLN